LYVLSQGEPLSSCIIRKTKKATVLSWHPTKKVVAVGWETGEVTAHNCQDNENYDIPRVHKTEITIMQWSSNGSRLLSGDVVSSF
jgi:intraflagellar transport protein 140